MPGCIDAVDARSSALQMGQSLKKAQKVTSCDEMTTSCKAGQRLNRGCCDSDKWDAPWHRAQGDYPYQRYCRRNGNLWS